MLHLTVKGMHCKSCKMLLEEELEDAGATNINVTVDEATQTGTVSCDTDKTREEIVTLIESLGEYTVE